MTSGERCKARVRRRYARVGMAAALIEAIPNVSEGRDTARLDRCAAAIAAAGATLLDRTADPSHHRAVFTVAAMYAVIGDGAPS